MDQPATNDEAGRMGLPATPDEADRQPLRIRLGWMALIWAGSVTALGLVAAILRYWIA